MSRTTTIIGAAICGALLVLLAQTTAQAATKRQAMCYHQTTIMNAAGHGAAEYAAAGTIFMNRMLDEGRPHFIVLRHSDNDYLCAW